MSIHIIKLMQIIFVLSYSNFSNCVPNSEIHANFYDFHHATIIDNMMSLLVKISLRNSDATVLFILRLEVIEGSLISICTQLYLKFIFLNRVIINQCDELPLINFYILEASTQLIFWIDDILNELDHDWEPFSFTLHNIMLNIRWF